MKNRVPASEIATAASPAVLKKCIWISRDSPDSPAPCASAARFAVRIGEAARPAGSPARSRRSPSRPSSRRARSRGRTGSVMAPSCPVDPAPDLTPGVGVGHDFVVITTVRPKPDSACVAAVDVARAALLEDVDAADVGEHLGHVVEGERVVTHLFACERAGYVGWRWSVTVARAPRQKHGHGRRDRADPRRRGDRRPGVGALPRADPARRPVPGRPAAGRRRRPAAGPDVLLRRRPARRRRQGADPHGRQGPRPRPGPHAVAGGPRARRPALVRRRRRPRRRRWPSPPRTPARPAASCSASPARSRSCSASAPTATPTTTAGSSPSTTAAARTPRSGSPRSTSRCRSPLPVVDTLTPDEIERF